MENPRKPRGEAAASHGGAEFYYQESGDPHMDGNEEPKQ